MLLNKRHRPDVSLIPEGVRVEWLNCRGHYDFLAARAATKLLGDPLPDLAIAHCSRSVALLKRALKGLAPVVAVSHSNKVARMMPADAYIVLTEHIRHQIERQAGGVMSKPCFVVPNMIAIGAQTPPASKPFHRPPHIAALGRFDRVKGFDVFIDALALLRSAGVPFRASLGGSGVELQRLRAQAQQRGLQGLLAFPGWIDQVDVFLSQIDVLCVPARSDAFGLTPLQAAVRGVPLVLSEATGHREMFEAEEQALFCSIADAESMARQLQRLIADEQLVHRLRSAAFDHVTRRYSEPVVADRLLGGLQNIVDGQAC
jgi:glycosyltransferase involved in cell wall biosynthesis